MVRESDGDKKRETDVQQSSLTLEIFGDTRTTNTRHR